MYMYIYIHGSKRQKSGAALEQFIWYEWRVVVPAFVGLRSSDSEFLSNGRRHSRSTTVLAVVALKRMRSVCDGYEI